MTLPLSSNPTKPESSEADIFVLPLSFAQQRLWFLDRLDPGNPAYNIPYGVRLKGSLDLIALERSLNEIVRRHEILRTTFTSVEGEPVQQIVSSCTLPLKEIDLESLPESKREEELQQLIQLEAWQPFDLSREPLLRVSLVKLAPGDRVLLLTMHHIISDAWSIEVFVREAAILYEAFAAEKPSPLPELPIQYADFALWQRQWLQGKVLETQLNYWKQQLEGAIPLLPLPTDFPRPAVPTFQGARQTLELPKSLTESLKALSHQAGTTLFITLLSAFKVLLYRYTSQTDISVGTPIANRNRSETEKLIGFFVNTLVLRTDLSGNLTFRELLALERDVALEAYAHQDLPFEKLVEQLQPERSLSHTPLFQVMFAFESVSQMTLELPGLTLTPLEIPNETAKFDLTLFVAETPQTLVCTLKYKSDLFEAETIARMLSHWQTLLENAIANPDRAIAEIPFLTDAERQQLLVDWNDTQVDYPLHRCLHHWVEDRVAESPDAVAVVLEGKQLTYRELNRRANQLAHYLQKLGVRPGSLVGICLERSLEMTIAILGTLKAGAAYVPLDPTYPQQRLSFMLQDAQIAVLLTQETLPISSDRVVCLDTAWECIEKESSENPSSGVTAEHLAYVIYTSGSTGKPKGVTISHRAICNRLLWGQSVYPLTESDRVLQQASFSFDFAVWEFFAPWLAGGQLILIPPEMHRDSAYLVRLIAEQKITVAHFVPSLLQAILEEPGIEACQSLKWLFCGGESLSVELQKRCCDRLSAQLYNQYGPTEATVDATFWRCRPEENRQTVPIGRPIANTQIYILDECRQPVPIGVPGELWIGGVGLAQGYLNRPDLTNERFIPNPFSNKPGSRLYRTGDLARYRRDGAIEFLGRCDRQVKIRGFRIELGEIEAALRQHDEIKEAVMLAREDFPGKPRLVAYFVSHREYLPHTNELIEWLQQKLPDYTIPSAFVSLEAFPLLPNGKLDRQSLPAPDVTTPEDTFVAPRTPVEDSLAQIWSQVLRLEKVSIHDNFFALGGDSILSLQVVAKANQMGLQLTPKQIFEHQTIARLATVVGTVKTLPPEQGIVTGSVPLNPIQCWFFEQAFPDSHHWNQSVLLEVQAIAPQDLEQIVQRLLAHHDALRLRFIPTETDWQAVNADTDATVPFSVVNLSALPTSEQKAAMEAAAEEFQTSLNLQESLVRVVLFELGTSSRLLIVIHHLVVDGVSWRILLEDFQTAYQQLSRGETIQFPPKTTSFKQWTERLQEYARSNALDSEVDYWLKESYQTGSLPVDFTEGDNTVASEDTLSIALTQEETQSLLQEVPVAYQTQIQEVLLAALVQAFARWTGERSLLVDLEGHGREDILEGVDLSRTVGWFTTLFPVQLALGATDEPEDTLKTIKEQLRSIPNRGIGYGIGRYLCRIEQLQALPQAQVKFNYLGQFDQVFATSSFFHPASESGGSTRSPRSQRSCLLEIIGSIAEGRLQLAWIYSKAIHQRTTIERLAQTYLETLRSLILHCQSPDAGGYTPSDFPQISLNQSELDGFLAELDDSV